jgi:hypothetical protein
MHNWRQVYSLIFPFAKKYERSVDESSVILFSTWLSYTIEHKNLPEKRSFFCIPRPSGLGSAAPWRMTRQKRVRKQAGQTRAGCHQEFA